MNLEEFLNQINFNDIQKNNDFLFSDLEDDDEPIQRKQSENFPIKDSNDSDLALSKRVSRKRSVISSAIQP
jgi:hypothetical protein